MRASFARARKALSRRRAGVDLRGADAEVLQVLALQSGDAARIADVLDPRNPLSHAVAAHAIPLLGVDAVARDAIRALQAVAEPHAGKLVDTLLDRRQPVTIRRRVPRVLSACGSQRVVDGLLLGLRDEHPDVRTQCGRALLLITGRHRDLRVDGNAVADAVLRELTSGAADLARVFTLLTLMLPRKTVRRAYRALRSGDAHLRGTALEYLHGVLPPDIREALWPHLEDR